MLCAYSDSPSYFHALNLVCLDKIEGYMCMIAWLCELLITSTLNLVLSLINSMTFVLYVQRLMASGRHGRPQAELAPEGPADFMATLQEMAYAMRDQAMATH